MLLNPEDSVDLGSRRKVWPSYVLISALTTAATGVLLFCPCDLPSHNRSAFPLIALSAVFGLAAAAVVYRHLQRYTGITVLLRAFYAAANVALAVYFEFNFATNLIAWLARPH